jgi:hypothetical protein
VDESASESNDRYLIEMQPSVGSALQKAARKPAFAFALLFSFPWLIAPGNCPWPGG